MDAATMILEAVRREVDRRVAKLRPVRWGIVDQVNPLRVLLPGDTTATPAVPVDGYTPTVGATTVLLTVGRRLWAIGERA